MTSELRFDGRTAIVTGAGRGLGRAYALELASRGAQVVVNDLGASTDGTTTGEPRAAEVVNEIEAAGGRAVANSSSVATAEGGREIIDCALETFGSIDIVVNNAGHKDGGPFATYPEADFDKVLQVHLRGSAHVTQPAWQHMLRQGYGRVVFTASSAALGLPMASAYSASKSGILGLTRTLALEVGDADIRVNAILPSARTPGNAKMPNATLSKYLDDHFPPALVAPAVALLSHECCPWNGEAFSVGGGRMARVAMMVYPGYHDNELTLEKLAENAHLVMAEEGANIVKSFSEELQMYWDVHPWPVEEALESV